MIQTGMFGVNLPQRVLCQRGKSYGLRNDVIISAPLFLQGVIGAIPAIIGTGQTV